MRTAPAALGKRVGAVMLNHLVASARAGGMTRLSLETGKSPLFTTAHRIDRRGGFFLTGAFGDYAPSDFTIFYTRII